MTAIAAATAASPPRRCGVGGRGRPPRWRPAGRHRHRRPRWGASGPPVAAPPLASAAPPDGVARGRGWGTPGPAPRRRWSWPPPAAAPRRRGACAHVGGSLCWPPQWPPAPQRRHPPAPRGSGGGHASAAPPADRAGAPGRAQPEPPPAPRRRACARGRGSSGAPPPPRTRGWGDLVSERRCLLVRAHPQKLLVMRWSICRRVKMVLSFRKSRVFSRTRFQ